ncbi:MAG TPA: hypothetical protein VFW29_05685 [Solirubrobacteraceae bacterium]|nr:hypothetical protein [Solirubrobacteraceae bacterium]
MSGARTPAIGERLELAGATERVRAVVAHPAFSYAAILAIQLRVVWGVWQDKDLTVGDTANYFVDVTSWAHGAHLNIVYNPLYSVIWGTILAVVHDVYAAATINRLAIVLLATVLVLATMRTLFAPALAFLIALWWAVVPQNFAVLYDVHLLGLILELVAVVVVARVPTRRGAGAALALLLADGLLVRTEMLLTTAMFALVILFAELRRRRSGVRAPAPVHLKAYAIPLAIALLLFAGAYWRSHIQGQTAREMLEAKQELNLCEAYAFNYQQRHPQRVPGNPFLECSAIMKHDFGRPMPSLTQAISANPRAMAGFFAWNVELLPAGSEVALFGATSSGKNPAYPPPRMHELYAGLLGLAALALILVGGALGAREARREERVRRWVGDRRWPLAVLATIVLGNLIVVIDQRPWAEYMYGVTIGLMVLVGMGATVLLQRRRLRWLTAPAAALAAVLVLALPSYYSPAPRPLYEGVSRLQPVAAALRRPGSVLVSGTNPTDLCFYLSRTYQGYCSGLDWSTLRALVASGTPLPAALSKAGATAIYADPGMVADPLLAPLLKAPRAAGWRQLAGGVGRYGPWRVLVPARPAPLRQ